MSFRDRSKLPMVTVLLLAGMAACRPMTPQASAVTGVPATSDEAMHELSSGMATALRASLGEGGFANPAERDEIHRALQRLARGSEDLSDHGRAMGPGTERLRQAMARQAGTALTDFEADRFGDAQRRTHQLLDHCFACHTRLPDSDGSAFGERIASDVTVNELAPKERIFFFVATRQFDRALAEIEATLRAPAHAPVRMSWLFEAYLKLSMRVHGSYERAREALEEFIGRSEPPRYLALRVRTWIQGLDELEARGPLPRDLDTVRALIDEGRERNEFPADRRGLVQFVAASGLLLRLLEDGDRREDYEAELYFLLGVAESHISSTLWTDQTDFFLETAIHLSPHSQLAMRAHSFLLEYVIAKHSGASGTFLPDSVRTWLDELAELAEPEPAPENM